MDQGRPLVSEAFRNICATLGIRKLQTTARQPTSNDEVERVNRPLKAMLDALVYANTRWWEDIDLAVYAYNTTPHSSTGYSPYYLIQCRKPHLPIDLTLEEACTEAFGTNNEYVDIMEKRGRQAKELTLLNNNTARKQYKKYFDRHINTRPYKIGDQVMMQANYEPAVKGERFTPKYVGPLKITKFISEYVVRLEWSGPNAQSRRRLDSIITHISKLKPAATEIRRAPVLATIANYATDEEEPALVVRKKPTNKRVTKKSVQAVKPKKATKPTVERTTAIKKRHPTKKIRKIDAECIEELIKGFLKQARKPAPKSIAKRTIDSKVTKELERRGRKLEEACEVLKKQTVSPQTIPASVTATNAAATTSNSFSSW